MVTQRPNPLRDPQDRRLPRIAGPCGMVLFGVTGDLSRKKVMPAIYDLANRGLLPPGFSLVGFARRDWADQDFADIVHDSVKQHARTEFREETWKQLAEGFRFVPGDFSDDVAFDNLRRTIEELDRVRGTDGNHAFYLAIPPVVLRGRGPAAQGARPRRAARRRLAAGGDREAVRPRPRVGAGAQRRHSATVVPAATRSSGSTTTSARRPSRTSWRCGSPTRCSSRCGTANYVDHVQITMAEDVGIERPGRLLRRHRRGPRRDPEPPPPADGAGRDGGAHVVRRRLALRIEKQKLLASVALPAAARPDHRARAVRRRLGRAARRSRGFLEEDGVRKTSTHRDVRRGHPARRQPALGGRAVLPAHRQAAGPPGHRGGRRVQAGAAPAVQRHLGRGADPERPRDPGPARRGHDAAVRLQGAGHRMEIRDVNMDFVYGGSFTESSPGGLRAADPRRTARRPAAVPAARGGRAVLADPRPDPRALSGRTRKGRPEAYPSGAWGPASADKMLARDGRTWRRP